MSGLLVVLEEKGRTSQEDLTTESRRVKESMFECQKKNEVYIVLLSMTEREELPCIWTYCVQCLQRQCFF